MKRLFWFLLIFALQPNTVEAKYQAQKVNLVLKWRHQFQFAGYYAAVEQGYYSDLGLDVEIVEGEPGQSSVEMVAQGKAHFGVGNVEVLVNYLKGKPLVLLASIFQHSPSIFIVKEGSDIFNPHDFVDKTIMLETDERGYELLSMLYSEGIKPWQVNIVDHTQSINEFLTNKVDALSAYITTEPYFLDTYGIPYRVISPSAYGIDFYSDCLFTSKDLIERNPDLVDKFISATLKGWEYALNNKEDVVALIQKQYSTAKTYDQLIYEANKVHELINPELVAIGHTNRGRWFSMANFLYKNGLVVMPKSIDDFFYHKDESPSYSWSNTSLWIALGVLFAIFVGFFIYLKMKKMVVRKTKDMALLLSKLEEQNKRVSQINAQLVSAREAAEESLKDKSTFFAGLTTELKKPVKGMMQIVDALSTSESIGYDKHTLITEISSISKTLDNFSKDVTSIFSLDSSAERISYFSIEPNGFIKSFSDQFIKENRLKQNQLSLELQSPQLSLSVLIDRDKVLRIFSILIANALKHSPGVAIKLGWNNDHPGMLTFWLNDKGTGLTVEQLTKFNQFFSDSYRSFSKGAGYGLTLVKALVQVMRGKVWVTYEQSVGTTFYVKIPYLPIDKLLYLDSMNVFTEGHAHRVEYKQLNAKTVLVYEQQPNNYILIRSMLEGTGCTLIFADTMEKMLNVSMGFSGIDMALVGVNVLSNIDIDAIKKLRAANINMPVVANVTYSAEKRENYLAVGFTDVIQRPASRGQLIFKLLEFLG